MLRKILCGLFLILVSQSNALSLPNEFQVKERWFSWTTTFDIQTDEEMMGCVYRKIFSLMPEYHLEDNNRELLSKARMRFFSFGAVFDVYDAYDITLGTIEEKIFTFFPTFEMFSPAKHKLAKAKLNFWGTRYTITHPKDNHIIATIYRPFFAFKNNWTVTIEDPDSIIENKIHPHMFLVVMAFQVDREYWAALSKSSQQNDFHYIQSSYKSSNSANSNISLSKYAKGLSDVQPKEEDFLYIERITEKYSSKLQVSDSERFSKILKYLNKLLDSKDLSKEKKKALYLMLNQRLNQE